MTADATTFNFLLQKNFVELCDTKKRSLLRFIDSHSRFFMPCTIKNVPNIIETVTVCIQKSRQSTGPCHKKLVKLILGNS